VEQTFWKSVQIIFTDSSTMVQKKEGIASWHDSFPWQRMGKKIVTARGRGVLCTVSQQSDSTEWMGRNSPKTKIELFKISLAWIQNSSYYRRRKYIPARMLSRGL